ncbi:MAG: hypothetical protein QOC70_188, partial [Verrucomicrobiota bacterium]
MTINQLLAAAYVGAIAIFCFPAEKLSAQSPDGSLQLVLHYQESNETRFSSHQGIVRPVSLHINARLPFTLEVPREKAGYPVMVADLDGGQINAIIREVEVPLSGSATPPALSISEEGTIDLAFQAGNTT